jgi:16S rRNA (uracil1498-N3)-methyltransferase
MHLFYINNTQYIDLKSYKIRLGEEEARHAIKVLRLQQGDKISATDGLGNWFNCSIFLITKRECVLNIEEHIEDYGKRDFHIHIAVAPTKNIKRFEWFLEKATEIGIDEITPIITSHSERRELKVERSVKVITAAMKQSLKAFHPVLNSPQKLDSFLESNIQGDKFVAHLTDDVNQLELKNAYSPQKDVCILIGPEGDFSPEEITKCIDKGFAPVKMGNQRLRTETAAIVACNTIHFVNI